MGIAFGYQPDALRRDRLVADANYGRFAAELLQKF